MKRILLLFAFCPVLALAAGVAESAPVWNGREDFENGITTLHNPATPMAAEASVLRPDPMWRIGGEDDPAGTLFGLVTDARPTPAGTTWLLDSVLLDRKMPLERRADERPRTRVGPAPGVTGRTRAPRRRCPRREPPA